MSIYNIHDLPEDIPKDFIIFTTEDDMMTITKPLRARFGITYFVHVISFPNGKVTGLTNNKDVTLHFIVNKLFVPGVNLHGQQFPPGIYLAEYMGEQFPPSLKQSLIELFNLDHTLSIVEANNGYCDMFVFGAEAENYKIVNFYLNNLTLLNNFIFLYRKKAKNLIQKALSEQSILFKPSPKLNMQELPFQYSSENSSRIIQTEDNTYLTIQEIKCLELISKGKTAKEIAKIMKISPRTVEYHLNTSKNKLNCRYKSELIEKFTEIAAKGFWFPGD